MTGYTTEDQSVTNGSNTGTVNAELGVTDCHINSRYRTVNYVWQASQLIFAGLAPEFQGAKR